MDIAKFQTLLDTHGPHLANWPDRVRRQAADFLVASEAARRAHREATRLDAALRDAAPATSQTRLLNLIDRAMVAAPPQRQVSAGRARWQLPPAFARAGMMAAFALVCFAAGFVISTDVQTASTGYPAGLPLGHETTIRIGLE